MFKFLQSDRNKSIAYQSQLTLKVRKSLCTNNTSHMCSAKLFSADSRYRDTEAARPANSTRAAAVMPRHAASVQPQEDTGKYHPFAEKHLIRFNNKKFQHYYRVVPFAELCILLTRYQTQVTAIRVQIQNTTVISRSN